MADTKISALTNGGAVQNTDQIPVSRSGVNFRVQVGTAAAAATGDFATAAQGTLAGTAVQPGAITGSGLTQATARLLGRSTAGTGAVEEITLGTNLSFTGTTLNAAGGGGGSPAGSSGDYQYNNAGSFGAANLKHGTNLAELRNGTNAQAFRVYKTFTDESNGEWGAMRWNSNVLEIGAFANGTGTVRGITAVGSWNFASSLVSAGVRLGDPPGEGFPGLWLGATAVNSPSYTNYSFLSDGMGGCLFNAVTARWVQFRINNTTKMAVGTNGVNIGNLGDTAPPHPFNVVAGSVEFRAASSGVFVLGGPFIQAPVASLTLSENGHFGVEMTSNTAGNLVYRGSDGTTRRCALVFV
jgi:hypothetical protein